MSILESTATELLAEMVAGRVARSKSRKHFSTKSSGTINEWGLFFALTLTGALGKRPTSTSDARRASRSESWVACPSR